MLTCRRMGYRGDGASMYWPGGPSPDTIGDVFGPRPFAAHVATEGYNYDFHRGSDAALSEGSIVHAPMSGAIIRHNRTHFMWQSATELSYWALVNPFASLSVAHGGTYLALTAARVGAASFPAQLGLYQPATARVAPRGGNDWAIEVQFTSPLSLVGAVGIGLFSADLSQYAALEYDGTTATVRAVGTTSFTANGTTYAVAGATWLRVTYSQSTDTYAWLWSTDGSSWTTLTTESGRAFTSIGADFLPSLSWRSGDTNASSYAVGVAQLNFYDLGQAIASRFGNHVVVSDGTKCVVMQHLQTISASPGDFVHAGQPIARCGHTGFDATSGRILTPHVHIEAYTGNSAIYSSDAVVNPLAASYFPRTNTSTNVVVVRSTANDPDGVDSHLLFITVSRGDQDFDLNQISLTGSTATRTVNFNTRAGLNANNDVPKNNGVYLVPSAFDSSSPSYVLSVYFNKSVVGAAVVSYDVRDADGNQLASG